MAGGQFQSMERVPGISSLRTPVRIEGPMLRGPFGVPYSKATDRGQS